jgi:molybdate transport system substrate-binding protein
MNFTANILSTLAGRARGWRTIAAALMAVLLAHTPARAAEARIAVAANFTAAAQEIATSFQKQTGHKINLSFGSTGQLYAQITQGAPFDILLSADAARPAQAEKDGLAVAGTRFTYAIGRLVLWSANPDLIDAEGAVLRNGNFTHLAIANPDTAPYGAAAIQTLKALGAHEQIAPKIVQGESILQAYQFIASGNAELGFVALSQLTDKTGGSRWMVPENLYAPILQDAVLLSHGAQNEAAKAFLEFLKSPQGLSVIAARGYGAPSEK